jgi:hypothetical protein
MTILQNCVTTIDKCAKRCDKIINNNYLGQRLIQSKNYKNKQKRKQHTLKHFDKSYLGTFLQVGHGGVVDRLAARGFGGVN